MEKRNSFVITPMLIAFMFGVAFIVKEDKNGGYINMKIVWNYMSNAYHVVSILAFILMMICATSLFKGNGNNEVNLKGIMVGTIILVISSFIPFFIDK